MSESLRSLSDQSILSATDALVVQDRKITLALLLHLNEIERRKLYLARGYGSMFDYCTEHLKLPEPGAVRRLKTARCLARFPELYPLLESGEVNLTTVSIAARILSPENSRDVIARIQGRSKREVEAVVAEYEPCTLLPPDSVRTVVVPVVQRDDATSGQEFTVSGDGKESSTVPSAAGDQPGVSDVSSSGMGIPTPGTVKLERRAVVRFTAHEELLAKLDRIRSLASHRLRGSTSFEDILDFMADYVLAREDPAERQKRRDRAPQTVKHRRPAQPESSRAIPVAVRDEVFQRDRGRCTYLSTTGKRCNSTHMLQLDHRVPVARGGASTLDNLRLLCAYHNRLEAERLMGRSGPPEQTNAAKQPAGVRPH